MAVTPDSSVGKEIDLKDVEVRTFHTDELGRLVPAFLNAYKDHTGWTVESAVHYLREKLLSAEEKFLVAEYNRNLVAAIFPIILREKLVGFEIFIASDFQNRGLISLLIKELKQRVVGNINILRAGTGFIEEFPSGVFVEEEASLF